MMGLQYLRKDMARSISRDLYYLRKQAGANNKGYINQRLRIWEVPCWITAILKKALNNLQQTEDKKEKIQALPLAKECYSLS